MGQAQRRKQAGHYPVVESKERKMARQKVDYMDSIHQQSFMAMALAASMIARHKPVIILERNEKIC